MNDTTIPYKFRQTGEPMEAVVFWTATGNRRYSICSHHDGYQWGTGRTIAEAYYRAKARFGHPIRIVNVDQ